jgi:putative (di)nucleoside polyphosphate hydrolase
VADPENGKCYRRGVGMMVLNAAGEVLMCQRADASAGWQMSQGGIEEGEQPEAAALRELKEEIGTNAVEILAQTKDWLQYDLPETSRSKSWGGRYVGQRQKWFLMRFLGHDAEIMRAPETPEFRAWKWMPVEQIPAVVVAFKQPMYRAIVAEFRSRIGTS